MFNFFHSVIEVCWSVRACMTPLVDWTFDAIRLSISTYKRRYCSSNQSLTREFSMYVRVISWLNRSNQSAHVFASCVSLKSRRQCPVIKEKRHFSPELAFSLIVGVVCLITVEVYNVLPTLSLLWRFLSTDVSHILCNLFNLHRFRTDQYCIYLVHFTV